MKKKERPRIKIEWDGLDVALEILTGLLVIVFWIVVILKYPDMPDSIPIHQDIGGNIDAYGGKSNIFTLPIVATVLYIGLLILNKFPHAFNYPSRVTEKNAEKMYRSATKLVRFLKLSVVILFFMLGLDTIYDSGEGVSAFGIWMLPITFLLVFMPLIVYLILHYRDR